MFMVLLGVILRWLADALGSPINSRFSLWLHDICQSSSRSQHPYTQTTISNGAGFDNILNGHCSDSSAWQRLLRYSCHQSQLSVTGSRGRKLA